MKHYLIFSPAYKANGNHGTYYSIAICKEDGEFVKVIGDHVFNDIFHNEYTNINDVVGIPFTDADRFIQIKEVEIDEKILSDWESSYAESRTLSEKWFKERTQLFGNSPYDFKYNKKGKAITENIEKYDAWININPAPKSVDWYDFLKSIIHEN